MNITTPAAIILITVLVTSFGSNASAAKVIVIEKTVDVPKESLQKTLTNVEGYTTIFPKNVRSVKLIKQENEGGLAKIDVGANGFFVTAGIMHIKRGINSDELRVISGDFKGTRILTSLEKTWGYDGTPEMGTKVKVVMLLNVSGFLGMFGSVSEDMLHYSIDSSLLTLAEHSKLL